MRTHVPPEVREMVANLQQAVQMSKGRQFVEAEPALRAIREDARKRGYGYGAASYHLSFVCFRQGRLEEALELVFEAIAQDPLNPEYHGGFEAVVHRMREVIEAADLPPGDARIPRFHALLTREGEATVETHLALLRHLCAVGDEAEAARFSKALSVLHPGHPEVSRLRAGIELPADEGRASPLALALLPATVAKA